MELLKKIAKPRPVGTVQNQEITDYIGLYLENLGYKISKIPFNCYVWDTKESYLAVDNIKLTIFANPFSESFSGIGKAIIAKNLEELKMVECKDRILILTEDLAKEPLQPKDYPFYYPDEHNEIIDCLEKKKPCAIIAVTGETSMSGLKPFYMIEDGNFHIPVASLDKEDFSKIADRLPNKEVELYIDSQNVPSTAYQLIASKKVSNPKGTIVICAHMDTKYNTDGALDNASGVVTMLYAAKGIENDRYNIDIVPFNTEEYYNPQGELAYLENIKKSSKNIKLVINIDGVAHVGSKVAVAAFNFEEKDKLDLEKLIKDCDNIVSGQPWYAGDHAIFAVGGIKSIVVYASDIFEGCLSYIHCPKDTIDRVDENLIENAAEFICKMVNTYK